MTYKEALQTGACARYLNEMIDRYNYWEGDNARPNDVIFTPHTDRDGYLWFGVSRKEAKR